MKTMNINICLIAAAFAAGMAFSADGGAPASPDPQKPSEAPKHRAEFPADIRDSLRETTTTQVVEALKASDIPAGKGIVIAPIHGDHDNFARNLLKNAVTDAGLTCLEASDDMWTPIMKELGFNEGFRDLMDERTMTVINRQWASQILLYGRVRIDREIAGRGRGALRRTELSLHAADLQTRRHVWGKDFPVGHHRDIPLFQPAQAAAADLAVFVTARPSDDDASDLALEMLSIARETVGTQGFQIALDAAKADVAVQLNVSKSVFDRTGNYAVMEGSVRAIATVPARKGFYLGETRIDRERGERRLGDRDAMLSVRDGLEPKLVSWLGQNITPEKAGIAAMHLPCEIWMLDENAAAKFISDFCREAVGIGGIARCSLVSQDADFAVLYISYLPEQLPEGPVNALRTRHPELFPEPDPDL